MPLCRTVTCWTSCEAPPPHYTLEPTLDPAHITTHPHLLTTPWNPHSILHTSQHTPTSSLHPGTHAQSCTHHNTPPPPHYTLETMLDPAHITTHPHLLTTPWNPRSILHTSQHTPTSSLDPGTHARSCNHETEHQLEIWQSQPKSASDVMCKIRRIRMRICLAIKINSYYGYCHST